LNGQDSHRCHGRRVYGEKFVVDYFDATEARNVGDFLALLDTYRIDATLPNTTSPCGARAGSRQGLEAALCR
jgi:hypothetical protein